MTGDSYADLIGDANAIFGADVEPLAGGFSGETFLVRLGGDELVVRLYACQPERAEVDATLLRLLRGLIPVPEVLEARGPRPELPVGLLLTSRLPGRRLDQVLAEMDADDPVREQLGRAVGQVLVRLSGVPFLAPGIFFATEGREGPGLTVAAMEPDARDLVSWVEAHLRLEPFRSWPDDLRGGLDTLAREGAALLDEVTRICLVHSDFNPKNLLVDSGTGEVTGLVDWEYAHAGSPVTDLGNLLRFEQDGTFARTATETMRTLATGLPDDLVAAARAADLFALVDLAARPTTNSVVRSARGLLSGYARDASLRGAF